MTWPEAVAAAAFLVDERFGKPQRDAIRAEEAKAARTAAALRKIQPS